MALTKITTGVIADGAVPTTGIVGVSTFTSSGTWTKATRESALGVTIKRVIVEVQGAGGGGGGSSSTGTGGNAGSGGYCKKFIDVSSISTAAVTVGSAGTGGTSAGGNGNDGGNSSWSDGTNTLTGNGGTGGVGSTGGYSAGGSAGSSSGGDINIDGQNGQMNPYSRFAGSSFLGLGGVDPGGSANKYNGSGYGAGGTGMLYGVGTGGNGSGGIVIVTEIAG